MRSAPEQASAKPDEALARAESLIGQGKPLDAIDVLRTANRSASDPAIERKLVQARYASFGHLDEPAGFDCWPPPVTDLADDGPARIPEITPGDLSAETVRRNIVGHGSVLVRGLLDDEQVATFVAGIDAALAARAEGPDLAKERQGSWFSGLPLPRAEGQTLGRAWVSGAGGILAVDSPRNLFRLFETYEEVGLREVVTAYLGERPVLSANKCTLRLVPLTANTDWHQDGAFLGQGIRALNVWIALSDCGVDSPGMDLLPRRLDLVETGTGGAIFDWAVGPAVVDELAVESPVVRPVFKAGDALMFDDLFLHRTALEPSMTRPRYAIESWFFAPSTYPSGQVPIVW